MYCRNCGCELRGIEKFCPRCGHPVSGERPQPSNGISKGKKKAENDEGRKDKTKTSLIISVVFWTLVLAAAVIFTVYWVHNKRNDHSSLALVQDENGKYGYINESGKEVVACQYDLAFDFSEYGLAAVGNLAGESTSGLDLYKWGLINQNGKYVVPMEYDKINVLSLYDNDLLIGVAYQNGEDQEGDPLYQWGFIDQKGNEVISFQYDSVGYENFETGFDNSFLQCVAIQNGTDADGDVIWSWGLINEKGEEVIPIGLYEEFGEYNGNGLISVKKIVTDENGDRVYRWGCVDEYGNVKIPFEYRSIQTDSDNGYITVEIDDGYDEDGYSVTKYGFIDQEGNEVIPAQFKYASVFHGGLAAVENAAKSDAGDNNSTGFINEDGYKRISYEYCHCGDFNENGTAVVEKFKFDDDGNKTYLYGMINEQGEEFIPCEYEHAYCGKSGMYIVKKYGRYGIINQDGEFIKNKQSDFSSDCFQYDYIHEGENGWIEIEILREGSSSQYDCKYIDEYGNTVLELPEKYIRAHGFVEIRK